MDLWNVKDLEAPPIITYKSSFFIEIYHLQRHFQHAIQYFSFQTILEKEAALLSRCIYRMKLKFRSDKGLQSMEKLNRALLQYNYLNFYKVLSDFLDLLPKENDDTLYLPTRNRLDYILVRLQGVTAIMVRITETAQIVADSMGSRICIGHLWKVATIILAVVSRIWFICKDITQYCCKFYVDLKELRNNFKNIANDWLPSSYIFPERLETWLNIDWLNVKELPQSNLIKSKIPIFNLIDSSDVEECGEYIEVKDDADEVIDIVDEVDRLEDSNMKMPNMFERLTEDEDIGEAVSGSANMVRTKNNLNDLSSDREDDFHMEINHEPSLELTDTFSTNVLKTKHNTCRTSNRKDNKNTIKKAKLGQIKQEKRIDSITHESGGNIHFILPLKELKKRYKQNKRQKIESNLANTLEDDEQIKKERKKQRSSLNIKFDRINSLKDVKKILISVSHQNSLKVNQEKLINIKKRIKRILKQVNNNLITETESIITIKNLLKKKLTVT